MDDWANNVLFNYFKESVQTKWNLIRQWKIFRDKRNIPNCLFCADPKLI